MAECTAEPTRGTVKLISDVNASADELHRRLGMLHEEIDEAVWGRGEPWSSVPLVSYVAEEILYLEEARRVVSRRCSAMDYIPALSWLGLRLRLDELPKGFGAAMAERALGLRDAGWWGCAVNNWNDGDRTFSADDLPPSYSWADLLKNSHHPCDVGPYCPWPKRSGAHRPWFSMRLVPGNVPAHREIHVPSVPIEGLGWNGCFEVIVTKRVASKKPSSKKHETKTKSISGTSPPERSPNFFDDFGENVEECCDDGLPPRTHNYPEARLWLVEDRWVCSSNQAEPEPSNIHLTFCGRSVQDVIVMGQPRWWLELCVAVVLARGNVLSRWERSRVVDDLAQKMSGRVEKNWKSDEERAGLARPIARRMFDHLVESFQRPLSRRSLGGTFKYWVCGKRVVTGSHPSATRVHQTSVQRDGVESAADFDADSPEDLVHLARICERVLAVLSIEISLDESAIASRSGLAGEDLQTALSMLEALEKIRGNAQDGYRSIEC